MNPHTAAMTKNAITLLTSVCFVSLPVAGTPDSFHPQLHHLGNRQMKDWSKEGLQKPEGWRFSTRFETKGNNAEATLEIRQRNVVAPFWRVRLNDCELGRLHFAAGNSTTYLPIPSGTLRDGANTLEIGNKAARKGPDILVGEFRLHPTPLHELLNLSRITVSVTDPATGLAVPARITVTEAGGEPVRAHGAESSHTAVRGNTFYTMGEPEEIGLPAGQYRFFATRGTEWGLGTAGLSVDGSGEHEVALQISREVDTTGFIAADTHIHTLEFSGHGDASVAERLVTLAGEGVELAIATDHNHHTDYHPQQQEMGLHAHFTSVIGNEVSTKLGHINAFPFDPGTSVPDVDLPSWTQLYAEIRAAGAQVTILNHPRWPYGAPKGAPHGPFAQNKLNRTTGSFDPGLRFPFHGMEVINSMTENSQNEALPLYVLEDWMALLNHGETVRAVGSSDSHKVGSVVGQGRTYVPSATDDPAKINVDAACEAFIEGRTTISLGIVTDIRVAGEHSTGSTYSVPESAKEIPVRVRVAAPSWVTPTRAMLYVNGQRTAEKTITKESDTPIDEWVEFSIVAPSHDAHLIAVVLGEPVDGPFWEMQWKATMAATNPVFLDADGDGSYRSPRDTAKALIASGEGKLDAILGSLENVDPAVGVQVLDVLLQDAPENDGAAIHERARALAEESPIYTGLRSAGK